MGTGVGLDSLVWVLGGALVSVLVVGEDTGPDVVVGTGGSDGAGDGGVVSPPEHALPTSSSTAASISAR